MKQDLASVRQHAATPSYTYENVHQANSGDKSFSPDRNQQRITDFFVNVSKEESLRALGHQSDRERLELLEERLRQMEVTKKRLLEENKQLRAENQHLHDHGPNETKAKPKKKKSTRIPSTDDRVVGSAVRSSKERNRKAAKQKGVSIKINSAGQSVLEKNIHKDKLQGTDLRKNERPTIPAKPSVSKQGNAVPKQDNADESGQEPTKVAESHLYESAVPKNAGESKSVVQSNPTQHKKPMTFIVEDSVVKDVNAGFSLGKDL